MMEKYVEENSKPNKVSTARDDASLLHLSPFFDRYRLAEITPSLISEYKSKRRREGAAPGTVNREMALLKHAFDLAHKVRGWVAENAVMKVPMEKEPPSRDRWLSSEEERKLLGASPKWLQEIIIFAVETGCRRGEILSLEWKDVDLFKKTVSVLATKTGERRTIPLTQRAFDVLLEKEKSRSKVRAIRGDFLFSHPAGRKVNINTLHSAFEDAIEKAGIQDFHFHDLRHTFASRLAQSGVGPYTMQKLMGHSSFTMTQRHAHHFVESLRRGIEYFEASRIERERKLAQI